MPLGDFGSHERQDRLCRVVSNYSRCVPEIHEAVGCFVIQGLYELKHHQGWSVSRDDELQVMYRHLPGLYIADSLLIAPYIAHHSLLIHC